MMTLRNLSDKTIYIIKVDDKNKMIKFSDTKSVPMDMFFSVCKMLEEYMKSKCVTRGIRETDRFISVDKEEITPNDIISRHTYYHGVEFSGIINGTKTRGKISVSSTKIGFCTNNSNNDGCTVIEKQGYKYCWSLDSCVDWSSISIKAGNLKEADKYYKDLEYFTTLLIPLSKTVGYNCILQEKKLLVGCNRFNIEDILEIYYKMIPKEIIIEESRFLELSDNLAKAALLIATVSADLQSLKTRTVKKDDPVKSGPKRDSNGRFVKC